MISIKKSIAVLSCLIMMQPVMSCNSYPSTDECFRRDTTLLELFYGMERHYDDTGQSGCVLDSLPGVLKQDVASKWVTFGVEEDIPYQYDCSFCVYVDSIFPSQFVADKVSHLLDSLYVRDFIGYFTGGEERRTAAIPVTDGHDILYNAKIEFNSMDSCMCITAEQDTLPSIFPFRTSFVACRIYGNEEITTYLLESSVDYNGSCGCPSAASYFTLDNRTGDILKYRDMIGEGKDSQVYQLLFDEYCKEFRKREGEGTEPVLDVEAIKNSTKENCAIVKEGILFYYQPYEIGCGAEGQYNLIIRI